MPAPPTADQIAFNVAIDQRNKALNDAITAWTEVNLLRQQLADEKEKVARLTIEVAELRQPLGPVGPNGEDRASRALQAKPS